MNMQFKSGRVWAGILGITLMCFSTVTGYAEEGKLNNKPFSYFGAGNEFIEFEEHVSVGGQNLKLEANFSNPVQRSGGYIPLFKEHGLYIVTSATLSSNSAGESWDYPGIGTIQTDDSKISWNELNVAVARHLSPGHHLTFGFDYYTMRFTRFNFHSAPGTDAFNTLIGQNNKDANGTPNPYTTYTNWVNSGKNGADFPGLRPEANLSTVIEDFSCLTTMLGYRYDTFFSNPNTTWRFAGGVRVGLPLYYNIENSQLPNTEFTSYLDSGYDFGADGEVAWNFSKDFALVGRVDYNHKHRNQIRSGNSLIPENRVISIQSTLALNWAF
ncbi:hypothetical protein [Geobacter sp. OR-1]|uniref:hypothetical protein n=1 Tax=Geobacter sp. OR-1 TaxID=1266765 RepID=UPI00126A0133|nr:hypothetical protein [Geobacter sp. OR-1]